MSLTSPLGLMRHLRRPDQRLEIVPWLNVLLLAWMLSLLGARFVYAPGLPMALDGGEALPAKLNLPQVASGALPGLPTDAVLTVQTAQQNPIFILENGIHHIGDLREPLRNTRHSLPKGAPAVLLIKADGDLPLQTIMDVSEMARSVGFSKVVLAAKETDPAASANSPSAAMSKP